MTRDIYRSGPPCDTALRSKTGGESMSKEASASGRPAGQRAVTVRRATLPEQIVEYVRDQISQDLFRPGQKLTIQGLAEELQVSMTPVREALKILSAERLVDLVPNRGAVIAQLDPDEVAQMLAVYSRLEVMAGELAATAATPEDIADLRSIAAQVSEAAARADRLDYFHANQAFHLRLASASGNRILAELHRNLNARLYHVRFRGANREGAKTWEQLAREHHVIIDAIERGDVAETAALLDRHFRDARSAIADQAAAEGAEAAQEHR